MKINRLSICPLASGSQGNSIFVSARNTSILIDAGLSGIELEKRMSAKGLSIKQISAIIITHEHTDHVKGAGILSRRFNIPVYINKRTCQAASKKLGKLDFVQYFNCGKLFKIGNLTINPFSISHDAADPTALTIKYQNIKIGFVTDLGVATNLVKEHLKACSLLYLEANHDPEMLMLNNSYPWALKQRIKGRKGHLSNQAAEKLISEISSKTLEYIILSHLSEQNNTPEKALQTVTQSLNTSHVSFNVARPDKPGNIIHL
ncbi:MAG: MBL fold metallo-hydrolase [Desulfobacteraceae bacterium 4572_130]|nr:MAG: MBL fold metallo-hydrolase [Desulfobacteraceae bacterium 4572_130]